MNQNNEINKVFEEFEKNCSKTNMGIFEAWSFKNREWNQLKSEIQEIHNKDVILLQEHMKNIMNDNREKDKEIELFQKIAEEQRNKKDDYNRKYQVLRKKIEDRINAFENDIKEFQNFGVKSRVIIRLNKLREELNSLLSEKDAEKVSPNVKLTQNRVSTEAVLNTDIRKSSENNNERK